MNLIAGSYEKFIWGTKLKPLKHSPHGHTLALTKLFYYLSYLSPISSVAAGNPVAASSTGDATVHLYNLTTASSLGSLHHHSTTVTALCFYTPPHLSFPHDLLLASMDGSVCIFDTNPFVHLKTIRVYKKGGVNSLLVHPLGKQQTDNTS
ncbi:uncharacterized protein LOC130139342 [Syzygium oleosum]|uniref:uncharacterized protein LOC130139342 n=1 Tax=Syzygium oleosum TaxID=219896 RepID=UPI0024B9C27C|nr:uncharacterized protein LOC130139342 [Syzygium oleosum]